MQNKAQTRSGRGREETQLGKIYDRRLMLRILHYLKPSAGLLWVATSLLILFSVSSLAGPLITRIAIDDYIATGDEEGLFRLCLLWFVFLSVVAGLQYAQLVITNLVGQQSMLRLREDIYRTFQRLPISFFDRNPVGRLLTRVTNDVEVLNQMFTQGVVAIFGDFLSIIGIMIVLLIMHTKLALVTFISLPLVFIISIQFRRNVRRAFRQIRVALARINSYLQEAMGGIEVIKSFRREEQNDTEFDALNADHMTSFLRSVRAFAVYFPLVELVQSLAIALILWYGSGRLARDELTFGALVAFIQYVGRFFRPIRDLSDKFNILQDAMASSERIFSLLDEAGEPSVSDIPANFNPRSAIGFHGVSFSYDGVTPVLQNVTFDIPAGKTTAIVGATGAGKSTIIDLLTRFYEPTDGHISIGGMDIRLIPPRVLRRAIAKVQQDVFIFSGTIAANIRLWDDTIDDHHLFEVARISHADMLINRLPDGFAAPVTERGSTFSAGERQLLAFARALAFDPPILVLDEATASIDSETEALIQDALQAMIQERTAVVIAHRLSTIRQADQIVVIHHGRVCQVGTHEQLLARGGLYARLYRLQFQSEVDRSPDEPTGQSLDGGCDN